jgi:hypothetical protein
LLASATFVNETASGWQVQALPTPLLIAANTQYVVSVTTGNAKFSMTPGGLASQVVNGDLRSVVGNNGVFGAAGQFPTGSFQNGNYFRDIVFVADAVTVSSVSLNPTSVTGGSPSTGTVTLTNPAPTGGAVVTLTSDNAAAAVPPSVTVAEGTTTANFSVTTTNVATTTFANILASYNGFGSALLTINPSVLSTLSLNPPSVTGGLESIGTVTLNGPAPSGGALVTLSSDNAVAVVPPSVTVAGGATSAEFSITTSAVSSSTSANISATYNGTLAVPLTINAPVLATVSLDPATVVGGNSTTGTATLTGPAPAGGAVVTLSNDNPIVSGILGVYSPADLPAGGSIDWGLLGAPYSTIASGTVVPITGLPGVNLSVSNSTGLPLMLLTNCSAGGDCGWYGNFAPDANLLWMNGTYNGFTGWWAPNGPLTLTLDSPQRGLGFQIMADEFGPFTATLCAYNAADTLLGCVPFQGNATATADGSAAFVGLYDEAAEISKVTIDASGLLYPHDFAIAQLFVTGSRRPMTPVSVTVPAGATSATFPVNTGAVAATTAVNITGNLGGSQSASLTIDPAALSAIVLNPDTVIGGASLTGTATLNGAAPAGGAVVLLSADNPPAPGIQRVTSLTALPQDGSVNWTDLGPSYSLLASGTTVPVTGLPGLTLSVASAPATPLMILTNCPAVADCGWDGDFVPAAPLLWPLGAYTGNTWNGHGPITLTLSSPQRGLGFHIMADEIGPFTATLCAYNSADVLLGCADFQGDASAVADGTASYIGVYDDAPEIAKLIVDAGGARYPHDFAIGRVFVASSRRMVPSSVKVQAGATTATFPVNTDVLQSATNVTVTGDFQQIHAANLLVNPPVLSSLSLNPASVTGGNPSTATVTLSSPAPAGGTVVALSTDNPPTAGAIGISSPASLPQDGSINWADLGPSFTNVASGTVVPVTGLPGLSLTFSNAAGQPLQILTQCPAVDCGWSGNFAPGASVLWTSGTFNGSWNGNGPITVSFSSPQRGLGFQIMADETGPFTATLCAYNAADTLLGCSPFNGNGTTDADNSAIFVGLYDDAAEIAKVTIDAGGALYPHDFAIGQVFVANTARQMIPASVTVPEGSVTADFPVTTFPLTGSTIIHISGTYDGTTRSAELTVTP